LGLAKINGFNKLRQEWVKRQPNNRGIRTPWTSPSQAKRSQGEGLVSATDGEEQMEYK